MRGTRKTLLAAGILACGLSACSEPQLAELPVRSAPQVEAPHTIQAAGAPLRGTAVAVDLAAQ